MEHIPVNTADEERKARRREYCARNRDRINQQRRESRERMKRDHPDKWAVQQERQRQYGRERYRRLREAGELGGGAYDPERRARYIAENRERYNQWRRTYLAKKKASGPAWWAAEQAKKREREKNRADRKRDPEKAKVYRERSAARKAGLPLPPLPGQGREPA